MVFGGHEGAQYLGSADVNVFNHGGSRYTWNTLRAPMNAGRWYGTSTVLANGEIVIISGSISKNQVNVNPLPQVWRTNEGGGWRNLTNALRKILYYPTQFVGPNGLLYVTGRDQQTIALDTAGTGKWYDGPIRTYGDRYYGSTAMYGDGKLLMAGGGGGDASGGGSPTPPTATCEVIDLSQPSPQWHPVGSMHWPRRHMNATILPDGKVLATGGSSAPNTTLARRSSPPRCGTRTPSGGRSWPAWRCRECIIRRRCAFRTAACCRRAVAGRRRARPAATATARSTLRPTCSAASAHASTRHPPPSATASRSRSTAPTPIRSRRSRCSATRPHALHQHGPAVPAPRVPQGLRQAARLDDRKPDPAAAGAVHLFVVNAAGVPSAAKHVRIG
jgi:hypothetical protein